MFVLRVMYQLLSYWNIVECILMSMTCRPMWPFLLMCVSRDTRRRDFPQVDGLSTDTLVLGRHNFDPRTDVFGFCGVF